MNLIVRSGKPIKGILNGNSPYKLPGDKSLSHRAALFAALATGESRIGNFLDSGVTNALLIALRQLGVTWELKDKVLFVQGKGLDAFQPTDQAIKCGNSATTMRLLTGALSASGIQSVLDGSAGLRKRPMDRIVTPLRAMGVPITANEQGSAPLHLQTREKTDKLRSGTYALEQASAQVKTCLLLAGLGAEGEVVIHEPVASRDHSERMLRSMGVDVRQIDPLTIALTPPAGQLKPLQMDLPGDFSAAAFLIVAALITPASDLWICDVGLNPGRTGLLDVLLGMGAKIEIQHKADQAGEPIGDLHVQYSQLQGTNVSGDLVVRMIDEFPVFAIAAAFASGVSQVCDAQELRYKESDRISMLIQQLNLFGVQTRESMDGFTIFGNSELRGGRVDSQGDHRLAMSMAVTGLASQTPMQIHQAEIISESFPHFSDLFKSLGAEMEWLA